MANHPRPHLIKHNGIWHACYGNKCKGSKFRIQTVIAEGETPFIAHCKYLEALEPQRDTLARVENINVDEVFEESRRVVMAEFWRIGKKALPVILSLVAGFLVGRLYGG